MPDEHIDTDESPRMKALSRRVDELGWDAGEMRRDLQELKQRQTALSEMIEESHQH
jgi:hypothetical protein